MTDWILNSKLGKHVFGGWRGEQTSISQIKFLMMKEHFDCRTQVFICHHCSVSRCDGSVSLSLSITPGKDSEHSDARPRWLILTECVCVCVCMTATHVCMYVCRKSSPGAFCCRCDNNQLLAKHRWKRFVGKTNVVKGTWNVPSASECHSHRAAGSQILLYFPI